MTVPYYAFLDAGMDVDVASPRAGTIPVDPLSLKPVLRCGADDRFLADDVLRAKVTDSLAIGELDMADYDIVFLAGGWGAAFDFGISDAPGRQGHRGQRRRPVHRRRLPRPARPLPARRPPTAARWSRAAGSAAVTDKQVRELGIESTPLHPETELRRKGARFESATRFRDPFANHWVVDGDLVTGQNQNAGPMVAREMMRLVAARTP